MYVKKKSKALIVLFASLALICSVCFFGCAKAGATLSQSVDGDSATVTVSAINGNTLTVSLQSDKSGGSDKGGNNGGGSGGSVPDKPSGDSNSNGQGGNQNNNQGDSNSTPPEKPDGDSTSSNSGSDKASSNSDANNSDASNGQSTDSSTPPTKPDGDNNSSNSQGGGQGDGKGDGQSSGQAPSGEGGKSGSGSSADLTVEDESIIFLDDECSLQGSIDDIAVGATLQLSVSGGTNVSKIIAGKIYDTSSVKNGSGAKVFSSDASEDGKTYDSQSADTQAVRVENKANVTLNNPTVTKTGDSSSSESSDFYGLNAGVYAWNIGRLQLSGGSITTNSSGSNGLFVYGSGSKATINNTTIKCLKGNSGGIEVAGGAKLVANNLNVDTAGANSAAIRSDRGGGTQIVTGGTYASHGKDSPAIYCTADVTVNNANLSAENSEGCVIEGKNSITLNGCTLDANKNAVASRTGVVPNIMLYQSMSGDASEGTSNFSMSGGTFKATAGTLFYVTNNSATIKLNNVNIQSSGDALLTVAGNNGNWGSTGKNGGTVTLDTENQTMQGNITVDAISKLTMTLGNKSAYTGSINSTGQNGTVDLTMNEGSTWTLTEDAYVSSLSGNTDGINLNGHKLYVNGTEWSK